MYVSRLRRNELVSEDTGIHAVLSDPKIVHGQFGRQVEAMVRVLDGDYKGTTFKEWFSFGVDKDSKEEFVRYGSPLYTALTMVTDNLDEVLDEEDLTDREYEKFLKSSVKKLNGVEVMGRVGIRQSKKNPEKKRNFLQPGMFGPYQDPDALGDDLPDAEAEPAGAPAAPDFD
jgi:hypothetical protein